MYRLGRAPWDTGVSPPELIRLVEGELALPPGHALDLGCGTGTNCLYLAAHGWQATGVDLSRVAISRARRRAAGVSGVRFVVGDVTRLDRLDVDGPFDLVLDMGCFHGLPAERRPAYASQAARVARPGATLLMFAFTEARGRLPHTTEAELRRRFDPGFELVEVIPGTGTPAQAWFRFRRRPGSAPSAP